MYKNVNRVLVGSGANTGSGTLQTIKKGDLLLVDESGKVLANANASKAIPKYAKVYIAMGIADGEAVLSSPIQGNTVSNYVKHNYVAPVQAVRLIGPNIEATADTQYHLRILIKDQNRIFGEKPTLIDFFSIANGSQEDLALDFMKQFYTKNYGHNFQGTLLQLDRVNDGTVTTFGTGINITVVKGSTLVSAGAAHGLTAGDHIRIQGIDYVVATVPSSTTFTLDIAYTGVSETITAGDANTGKVATITNWGLRLTGLAQNSRLSRAANEPIDEYEWVVFDASFSSVDAVFAADVTKTEANPGNGYWKQVAQAEHNAKGYLGDMSRRRYFDIRIDNNVDPTKTYGSIVITHAEIMNGDFQDTYRAPLQTEIFIPSSTTQGTVGSNPTTTSTNFIDVLNGYLSISVGFPALTTLT